MGRNVIRVLQLVGVILLVVALSLLWTSRHKLGRAHGTAPGVRLLYEIKIPPETSDPNIADSVARALAARVDPDGTCGIVVRPTGPATVQVQIPTRAGDIATIKRMLRGAGALSFHVVEEDKSELDPMVKRLAQHGPARQPEDMTQWFEVSDPEQMHMATQRYGGKVWLLVRTTPDQSMAHDARRKPWSLKRAYRTFDSRTKQAAVGFEFDPQAAILFGDLSGANIGKSVAIALDGRIISAPRLNSRIEGNGIITGNFSDAEIRRIVQTLNAGSLPARLADEPISEQAAEIEVRARSDGPLVIGVLALVALAAIALLVLPPLLYGAAPVPPPLAVPPDRRDGM